MGDARRRAAQARGEAAAARARPPLRGRRAPPRPPRRGRDRPPRGAENAPPPRSLRVPRRARGTGRDSPRHLRRERAGRLREAVHRAERGGVAGRARRRRARRADARPGSRRRPPRTRVVHPPPAARADCHPPGTLNDMEELRERALTDGWRKLVVDGVTATPVDLARGPALKIVDGARTETVDRSSWPERLDA